MATADSPADLIRFYDVDRKVDVVFWRTANNVLRHYVLSRHLAEISGIRDRTADDIPICDNAHQTTVCAHWNSANVAVTHALCKLLHGSRGLNASHSFMHDILDFHTHLQGPGCEQIFNSNTLAANEFIDL